MKTPLALTAIIMLLASLGCAANNPDHASFWDMKPDPRAYSNDDRSPYVGE